MPFRTRIKRALTRGREENGTKNGKKGDPNVYQPGEKMPPLKYRRPVDPAHKAHLESYSWASAWRRRSHTSLYSPMGSRLPSRKSSNTTLGRRSIGGRSMRSVRSVSRRSMGDRKRSSQGNDGAVDSGFGGSLADDVDRPSLREGSDEEGDVTNVGLSRNPTQDPRNDPIRKQAKQAQQAPARSESADSTSRPTTADRPRRASGCAPDQPFDPEELELALRQSHLECNDEDEYVSECSDVCEAPLRPREALVSEDSLDIIPRPRESIIARSQVTSPRLGVENDSGEGPRSPGITFRTPSFAAPSFRTNSFAVPSSHHPEPAAAQARRGSLGDLLHRGRRESVF